MQQSIGGLVGQCDLISRPPMNAAVERLDQVVGRNNLALLVENQRREAESGQRLGGGLRAFELQPRGKERATSEMRPQLVELFDDSTLHRSTLGPSHEDESHIFAGGDRNSRRCAPSHAQWAPHVTVDRFLLQFFRGENVEVDQKSAMARRKQASDNLSAPVPAFLHECCRGVVGNSRGCPRCHIRIGDEQCRASVRYASNLAEDAWPKLRDERAFVDSVYRILAHGLPRYFSPLANAPA